MAIITKALEHNIVARAIAHRFAAEQARVDKLGQGVAQAIYNDHYDAKTRKQMDSLPEGWLPEQGTIRASIQGRYTTVALAQRARFLYRDENRCLKTYDGSHRIADLNAQYESAKVDLKKNTEEARLAIRSALATAKTVKRLVADWPEIAALLPEPPPKANLPAIPVTELNAMLQLPVKKPRRKAA